MLGPGLQPVLQGRPTNPSSLVIYPVGKESTRVPVGGGGGNVVTVIHHFTVVNPWGNFSGSLIAGNISASMCFDICYKLYILLISFFCPRGLHVNVTCSTFLRWNARCRLGSVFSQWRSTVPAYGRKHLKDSFFTVFLRSPYWSLLFSSRYQLCGKMQSIVQCNSLTVIYSSAH